MNKINLIIPFLLLTGCSIFPFNNTTKPVEVRTIAEPAPMFHPPMPLELQLQDIEWEILTPSKMESILVEIEAGSVMPNAYYALTTQGYESLSENMAENKRYLRDIIAIVKYYRSLDKDDEEPSQTDK